MAVKSQVTSLHQLLFRNSINGLCQLVCCHLSWGTAASHFPFSSLPFFWALSHLDGTLSFCLAQVHQRHLCVLPAWWNHGLLPSPRTCSDCSVPSAVLLSASSPEFLRITEAQSLPRSKISCDPCALVLPQLRELQHFLADKKKSALLWGKCLIVALIEQCNQVSFSFVYLTIAV